MRNPPYRTPALSAVALIVLFFSCKKDDPSPTDDGGSGGPTTLFVSLPQWVLDSIGPMPIPPDNPLTVEGVALGRKLFYEEQLSDDGTMSCGTCHKQSSAFSDPRPFSIGTDGSTGTRNAMAIVNLAWDTHFFWDGRRPTLELQAHDPVANPIEMNNTWPVVVDRLQADPQYPSLFNAAFGTTTIDSMLVLKAIAQFERTLVSFNSRFDRYYYGGDSTALNTEEKLGLDIFNSTGFCFKCHIPGLFTDDHIRNNGLLLSSQDSGLAALTGLASDLGKFKVPTLRNIAASTPYMHDSRFDQPLDVVQFYNAHIFMSTPNVDPLLVVLQHNHNTLDVPQQNALAAFMATLTDSTFLTDPAFAEP
jgi:cytochrome c peroxidase